MLKKMISLPEMIEEYYGSRLVDVVRVVGCSGDLLKVYLSDRTLHYWQGTATGWNKLN